MFMEVVSVFINGASGYHEGLRLIEDANIDDVKFRIREQKYLELLEQGEKSNALEGPEAGTDPIGSRPC